VSTDDPIILRVLLHTVFLVGPESDGVSSGVVCALGDTVPLEREYVDEVLVHRDGLNPRKAEAIEYVACQLLCIAKSVRDCEEHLLLDIPCVRSRVVRHTCDKEVVVAVLGAGLEAIEAVEVVGRGVSGLGRARHLGGHDPVVVGVGIVHHLVEEVDRLVVGACDCLVLGRLEDAIDCRVHIWNHLVLHKAIHLLHTLDSIVKLAVVLSLEELPLVQIHVL